jgi:predicted ATPase/class 3 adenylate cyclase
MTRQPTGTVTFLFTDIEGSTRLLERLGRAAYAEALELHRRLLHKAFEQQDGYEVDFEGDAFFIAFQRAEDAVVAAANAQQALAAADWPADHELRVRMGIHTGEPLTVPPKYVGLDVHRAARLMAAGHGGQVLLSRTTRDLLDDRFAVRDLGEHRLKDLSAPQQLYQLQVDGLRHDFPPLRTLLNRPTNLPLQLTSLVGRERELADVGALLRDERVRLLTLTGTGGTGKTRLALQAAADVVEAFPDGVFFVSLAPIRDPELVLPTIAQTVGLREMPGERIDETLVSYLEGRQQTLLLLDNFEQLLDAAPAVAELIVRCPQLSLLVTSRERLRITGERTFAVLPLRLPDGRDDTAGLATNEAVALFAARAVEATGDVTLTDDNAATVAAICRRLDGLPLAIELAAARTPALPPATLLRRLDHSLNLLTGGRRDAEERQKTLRATIAWSYDLLGPSEQALFARLSVFLDGCRIEAAEEVAGWNEAPATDVFDGLASLVEANLVRQRIDHDGEPRYWMLETVREFGLDRLTEKGEHDEAQRRHARYFLQLAERARPHLTSEQQVVWLRRIHADLDNLRLAFDSFIASASVDETLRFATAVWRALWLCGHLAEGRQWLLSSLTGEQGETALRIEALRSAAFLAKWEGAHTDQAALADEALALARASGDKPLIAGTLVTAAHAATSFSDFERAELLLEESLELARELGESRPICVALGSLASLYRASGRSSRALEIWEDDLPLSRSVGDRYGTAIWLFGLAFAAIEEGQPDEAPQRLTEALSLARELDYQEGLAYFLEGAAAVASFRGDADSAAKLLGNMRALHAELGFKPLAEDERLNEDTAKAAQTALGQRGFQEALEVGEQMPREEALALGVEVCRPAAGVDA